MINVKELKEQQKEIHPGFNSYLECMTRTLFTGLSGFSLTFASVYFTQKLLESKLKYNKKYNIIVSTLFATVVGYKVTRDRTQACQTAWVKSEKNIEELSED